MAVILGYKDANIDFHHSRDEVPDPVGFSMHSHTNLELYVFIEGNCVFHVEGTNYKLKPGDILIMREMESHYIEPSPDAPYERASVNFDRSLIDSIDPSGNLLKVFYDRSAGQYNLIRGDSASGRKITECTDGMLTKSADQRLQLVLSLANLLHAIFLMTCDDREGVGRGVETPAASVVRFINANLAEPISIDMLCDKFYISRSKLCTVFKQTTGTTVMNYVTMKRLEKARKLMDKGVPATTAGNLSGFVDYSTFYRAYKKYYGVSPKTKI